MNIIVSKDKSIRLTQYSSQSTYHLEEIKVYISKEFENTTPSMLLKKYRNEYVFALVQDAITANYDVYKVSMDGYISLSERDYDIYICINEDKLHTDNINIYEIKHEGSSSGWTLAETLSDPNIGPFGLTDEHEPVDIQDRTILIGKNQNVLVAEDNISQCIRFRLPRYYDGVDLTEKQFQIDYLDPADAKTLRFILIPIEDIEMSVYLEGDDTEYILISWAVPNSITQKEGNVLFALSATGQVEDEFYVWQTMPASLVVEGNIGKRSDSVPSEIGTTLEGRVAMLEQSDIIQLDANNPHDEEVVFSAGDASSFIGGV